MNVIRSFFVAFSMYSKIPMPKTEWTKESMKYCLCFFPAIGAVIGGAELLWMYLAGVMGVGQILQTAVLVLIPVMITGGIHVDGLLDTADALSSYKPMEQKLEILKDSHAGAFAVIVGISYFLLYFGILSEADLEMVTVLAPGFILSRALSGFSIVSFRMAKNTGLAATFSDMAVKGRVRIVMALCAVAASAVMIAVNPAGGAAGAAGAFLTLFCYRRMAYQKFGGITGDLAGFFLQICELVMALFVTGAKFLLLLL